jgi:hypothetical protein
MSDMARHSKFFPPRFLIITVADVIAFDKRKPRNTIRCKKRAEMPLVCSFL